MTTHMNATGGARAERVKRVLVVEDDADVASALAGMVEIAGGRPFLAASRGALRKAIAEQMPFDLVVTESVMSWITGMAVVHACLFEQPPPVVFIAPRGLDLGRGATGASFRVLTRPLVPERCVTTFTALLSSGASTGPATVAGRNRARERDS